MKKRFAVFFVVGFAAIFCFIGLSSEYDILNASTDGASNALSDKAYKEFGLSINENIPSDFTEEGDDPFKDYEPTVPSWLYLGGIDRTNYWQGGFSIYDTLDQVSHMGLTINNDAPKGSDVLGANTIGRYVPYPNSKTGTVYSPSDFEYHTQNAVALNMGRDKDGKPRPAMIADTTLFSAKQTLNGKKKQTSQQVITLYGRDDLGNWMKYDTQYNYLVSASSANPDFFSNSSNSVDAQGKGGITSLASGDYDNDGVDEVAVYIPSQINNLPKIQIYNVTGKKLKLWKEIGLDKLSKSGSSQFNHSFYQWYFPVVALSTTKISGNDDLVITVSLPLTPKQDQGKYEQDSAFAIYGLKDDSFKEKYYSNMSYPNDNYRMRYMNAVDSDINGNGTKELIVGGYINKCTGSKDVGTLDPAQNGINALVWDGKDYKQVWDQPLQVKAHGDKTLDMDYEMTEPVALTSGKYDGMMKENLFLEGVLFEFVPKTDGKSDDEILNIKTGSFTLLKKMTLNGKKDGWISTCVTGNFGKADGDRQQTLIMSGDHNPTDLIQHEINYHLSWIWKDAGVVKIDNTNMNYYYHRPGQDRGTFLTPCIVPDYENSTYYKFKEKNYGWSAPEVLAIMPSIPNWEEFGSKYDAGSTSFTIESGESHGTEGNMDIGAGGYLSGSVRLGVGLLGSTGKLGGGGSLGLAGDFIHSHSEEHSSTQTVEYSVDAGEDNVVIFAVPVVIYTYDTWVPTVEVTQEYIDNYVELSEETGNSSICPYKVGDIIEGHYEETAVSYQYDAVNTVLSLEDYNDLAEETKGVSKVDMDKIMKHDVGDPSKYPRTIEEITTYDPKDVRNMSSNSTELINTKGNKTISLSKEHTHTNSTGFDLTYSGNIHAQLEFDIELALSVAADFEAGIDYSFSGGCQWSGATINGNTFTGTFNALPDGAEDYSYNTRMAVWDVMPDGSKAQKATKGNKGESKKWMDTGAFVIGYTADPLEPDFIPPKLPKDPFVYASSTEEIVLSWDDADVYRKADYYEAYIKKGGEYVQLRPKKIDPDTNYIVADGLKPDTDYRFAFKAVKVDEKGTVVSQSTMGEDIIGHTRSDKKLKFTEPPKDCYANIGDTASFSATVSKVDNAEETEYQWYKFTGDKGGGSPWQKIKGATDPTYEVGEITKDNKGDLDETKYKLHVDQYVKGASVPLSIDSRAVTLYIGDDDRPTVDLDIESASGGKLIRHNDEYYSMSNSKKPTVADLSATVKDTSKTPVSSGTVTFVVFDPDGNKILKLKGSALDAKGRSTARWDLAGYGPGTYSVEALLTQNQKNVASSVATVHNLKIDTTVYNINYRLNGGENDSANPSQIWIKNPGFDLKPAKMDGAKFTGWYTDRNLKTKIETVIPSEMDGDITLYAGFKDKTYNIGYDLDGGKNSPDNPTSFTASDTFYLKPATKKGYEFTGWFLKEDRTGKINTVSSEDLRDLKLYAGWKIIDYPITYVGNGADNTGGNPSTYTVRDSITFSDAESGDRKFKGWFSDSLYTEKLQGIKKGSTGSVTVYAKWGNPPLYDRDDKPVERTLHDPQYGISVSGMIHPAANLQVISYSDDAIAHEIIEDGFPEDKNVTGAYKINLVYPDSKAAPYDGKIKIDFDLSGVKDMDKNTFKVVQLTDNKKISELPSSMKGSILGAETISLNVIAPVGDPVKVSSIDVSTYKTMITPGEKANMIAEILPANAYDRSLKWNSSNKNVANVDSKGQVTGKGEGKATISATATDGSKVQGNYKITVAKDVTRLDTQKKKIYMKKGEKKTIQVTAYSPGSKKAKLTWSSSNAKIAAVDKSGTVYLKKKGNATITAKALNGKSIQIKIKGTN